jgi:hypothetical protein
MVVLWKEIYGWTNTDGTNVTENEGEKAGLSKIRLNHRPK